MGRLIRGASPFRWVLIATFVAALVALGLLPALALAEEEPPPAGVTTVTPTTTAAPDPDPPGPDPAPVAPAPKPKPKAKPKPASAPPAPAPPVSATRSAPSVASARPVRQQPAARAPAEKAPAPKPKPKAKPKPKPTPKAKPQPATRVYAARAHQPRKPADAVARWPRVAAVPLVTTVEQPRERIEPLLALVLGIPLVALVMVAASSLGAGRAPAFAWIAGRRLEVSVAAFSAVIGFGLALLLSNA